MLILCIIPSLWNMKKNQDAESDDIDQLMRRYLHLRVAYIDNIGLNHVEEFASIQHKLIENH